MYADLYRFWNTEIWILALCPSILYCIYIYMDICIHQAGPVPLNPVQSHALHQSSLRPGWIRLLFAWRLFYVEKTLFKLGVITLLAQICNHYHPALRTLNLCIRQVVGLRFWGVHPRNQYFLHSGRCFGPKAGVNNPLEWCIGRRVSCRSVVPDRDTCPLNAHLTLASVAPVHHSVNPWASNWT